MAAANTSKILPLGDRREVINELGQSCADKNASAPTIDQICKDTKKTESILHHIQACRPKLKKCLRLTRKKFIAKAEEFKKITQPTQEQNGSEGEVSMGNLYEFVVKEIKDLVNSCVPTSSTTIEQGGSAEQTSVSTESSVGLQRNLSISSESSDNDDTESVTLQKLVKWCAQFWFVSVLEEYWKKTEQGSFESTEKEPKALKLFKRFFKKKDDDGKYRFQMMSSWGCTSMIELLTKLISMEKGFDVFLTTEQVTKYVWPADMNKPIIRILSKCSIDSYIIPQSDEKMKRYVINLSIWTRKEGDFYDYDAVKEREDLGDALYQKGFTDISDSRFTREGTKFDEFMKWLSEKLFEDRIQTECSLLIFNIFCDGSFGYLWDSDGKFVEIKDLLKLINNTDELKEIPKFVILQICQHKVGSDTSYINCYDPKDDWKLKEDILLTREVEDSIPTLEDMLRTHTSNTHLVMVAEEGEHFTFYPWTGTILSTFAEIVSKSTKDVIYLEDAMKEAFDTFKEKYPAGGTDKPPKYIQRQSDVHKRRTPLHARFTKTKSPEESEESA